MASKKKESAAKILNPLPLSQDIWNTLLERDGWSGCCRIGRHSKLNYDVLLSSVIYYLLLLPVAEF